MALTVMPVPRQMFLNNSSTAAASGSLYTYVAGSTTDLATYSDIDGAVLNANPILLNSAGRPWNGAVEVNVYLLPQNYDFVLKDSAGVTIWTSTYVPATPTLTTALDITGVAGEAIAANDAVYIKASDGLFYKTDADATASSSDAGIVGIAIAAIVITETGTIRLVGRVTGFTSLSIGSKYYVSATAGGITATAPSNVRFVGTADSATTLVISPNPAPLFVVNDTNLLLTGQVFS